MPHKLIAHLTPVISLFADDRQYILVIRDNPAQAINNGAHSYYQTIGLCFEEILSHMTKSNLADGKDKTLKDMAAIMEKTIQEVRTLFKPFEELPPPKKG